MSRAALGAFVYSLASAAARAVARMTRCTSFFAVDGMTLAMTSCRRPGRVDRPGSKASIEGQYIYLLFIVENYMQKLLKSLQFTQDQTNTKPAAVVELSAEEITMVAGARRGVNNPPHRGRQDSHNKFRR